MILQRFYNDGLAQASYLVGCEATGEALVIDPNRDAEQYVRAAESEGLRIRQVTETHIHADFVSGTRELAARTGATMVLSDEGGPDWKYGFADDARLVRDGDSFTVGRIRIDVLHTPGHTPEHLTFLATDTAAADRPMGAFTGDFVFVSDVGRPDLLERAAGYAGTMEQAARQLHRAIQRFKDLPDYLQIWPGHGAGSACGKALGAVPQSTLGYERLFNWALREGDEDRFVRTVLADQPEAPRYFAEMKRINRAGPPILGGFVPPAQLPPSRLPQLHALRPPIVDTRSALEYARAHIPGTINIPLNRSFTTWAGCLIPYDRDFYLIVAENDPAGCVDEATRQLAMIGLDRIAGYFGRDAIDVWAAEGNALGTIPSIQPAELARRLAKGDVAVIDVRSRAEWDAGHIPGVPNMPLGCLTERLDEIPRQRPLVLHCRSGNRSAIGASVLRANGFANVTNLEGGLEDWSVCGYPVTREPEPRAG